MQWACDRANAWPAKIMSLPNLYSKTSCEVRLEYGAYAPPPPPNTHTPTLTPHLSTSPLLLPFQFGTNTKCFLLCQLDHLVDE